MARIETDPNYSSPTFSRATAGTDLFKKEDVQALAAAVSTHVHDAAGKGLAVTGPVNGSQITDGTITSAKILDGTIATADLANGSVTRAKLGADVAVAVTDGNLLTNGGFEIWQRGNGPFATTGVYTADRWAMAIGAGSSMSVSRDNANIDFGKGNYCAAVSYTHTATSSVFQDNENYLNYRGGTYSFSIRVKTTAPNAVRLRVEDGVAAATSGYHTGDGQYQTLTATLAVAGNPVRLRVQYEFNGSCTAYLDNAMLVVGSVPADYAPLHPADDLARCLRYYEKIGQDGAEWLAAGQATNATTIGAVPMLHKVRKAVTPTVTVVSPTGFTATNAAGVGAATTALNAANPFPNGFAAYGSSTGMTAGITLLSSVGGYFASEANP